MKDKQLSALYCLCWHYGMSYAGARLFLREYPNMQNRLAREGSREFKRCAAALKRLIESNEN